MKPKYTLEHLESISKALGEDKPVSELLINRLNKKNIMPEFKGTRGKWDLIGTNDIKVDGVLIACALGSYVRGEYEHTDECKANAKLIASAPEMLEMLEETFNLMDKLQMPTEFEIAQLRNKLFKLIKKATT